MSNEVRERAPRQAESTTSRLPLFIILSLYFLLATLYNMAIPVGEAPDEPDHIRFTGILLKTGQLPTIPKDSARYSYEAEQPPLYYIMEAAWVRLLWPGDTLLPDLKPNPAFSADTNFSFERHTAANVFLHDYPPAQDVPAHLMRLFSTLLGLLTLLFIWWSARMAWPHHEGIALAAVGFVAFLPGFTFTSATVTNDTLAATTGAAVVASAVYMLKRGITTNAILFLGISAGLGMLSKRSLIVMLPLLVLVPLLAAPAVKRKRIYAVAASLAIALLVGIWPLVTNVITYGDPFATAATLAAKPELISPLLGRPGYWLSPAYHLAIYNSLWGAFGIRSIDLPNMLYAFYYILCFLAIVGFIRRRKEVERGQRQVLLVGVATFLLINAGVAYQNTQFWAVQGRLLLPGIAAVALLVAGGLALVGRDILPSTKAREMALVTLLAVMLTVNGYALVQFILRAYYT